MTTQGHYTLYRFYDGDGSLLYIGVTSRGSQRFGEHYAKGWWPRTATVAIEHLGFMWRTTAMSVEAAAVLAEHPEFNKDHAEAVRQSHARRKAAAEAKAVAS